MAGLRELVLKLSANTVSFRQDIGAAVRQVGLFSSQITRSMKSANAAIVGFAAGAVSIAGMTAAFNRAVDSMAELDDMAQKTGSSVENLSRIAKVAKVFGGDLESVNFALNKLAQGMTGVDEESSKTKSALQALGISTKDLASQDPSEIFIRVAKELQNYKDGAAKAALVNDLFGKGAANLLPLLNDIAENIHRFKGTSAEAAAEAAKFQDNMRLLTSRSSDFEKSITKQVLPAFTDFVSALADVAEEEEKLGSSSSISDWAQTATEAATYVIDAFNGVSRVFSYVGKGIARDVALMAADNARERQAILDAFAEDEKKLLDSQLAGQRIRDKMEQARKRKKEESDKKPDQDKPELDYTSKSFEAAKKAAELAKKKGEAIVKALEEQVNQEKQILESRNRFLDLYNNENLLSFREYFNGRKIAHDEFVRNTLSLYDKEIAALQKVKASAKDEGDKVEAQSKINDLLQKKVELQRQAGEDAIADILREQKAYEDLQRELRGVNAELLELQGKAGEAARLRFGDQYSNLRKRLTAEGDQQSLALVDQLEKAKIAQADYNQLAEQSTIITDKLRNAEESAAIAQFTGAQTELETLLQVSEARQRAVKELEAIVINQEQVARSSENPALINQAEAARVALEKLRAESNLLGQKFKTIFVDNMANSLTEFATGAKSAKQAFKDFADGVVQQITRMAAEAVSAQIFNGLFGSSGQSGNMKYGGQSVSGGGGGFLSSLASIGLSLFSGGSKVPAFDPNSINMTGSAPGPAMSINDLMNFPGLAVGGPVSANNPYYVGEFGKEVFVPNVDGRIMPRSEFSNGATNVINITQNIPRDMSRQSAQQLAADTGMQVNRAVRRNT